MTNATIWQRPKLPRPHQLIGEKWPPDVYAFCVASWTNQTYRSSGTAWQLQGTSGINLLLSQLYWRWQRPQSGFATHGHTSLGKTVLVTTPGQQEHGHAGRRTSTVQCHLRGLQHAHRQSHDCRGTGRPAKDYDQLMGYSVSTGSNNMKALHATSSKVLLPLHGHTVKAMFQATRLLLKAALGSAHPLYRAYHSFVQ
ncbi:hypothetical protein ACA910_010944 [Epithemia clementina (nom. ined.)]